MPEYNILIFHPAMRVLQKQVIKAGFDDGQHFFHGNFIQTHFVLFFEIVWERRSKQKKW